MKPEVNDVFQHFKDETGIDYLSDLFHDQIATTHVDGYLLSQGRAVTTRFESYLIMRFGTQGSIYINVWLNCKLVETIFMPIQLLFDAADNQGETIRHKYHNDEVVEATFTSYGVFRAVEYRDIGDGEVYDKWDLSLTASEFGTLVEKLSPLRGYKPREEWTEF